MNDIERKTLLLRFAQALLGNGSWCGETHMQKATYFLQELTGVPLGFDFILWKHGPYSFDLADELEQLRGYGLMRYHIEDPRYGPKLVTSERAADLLASQPLTDYEEEIGFVTGALAEYGVVELEKVGTALLVTKAQPGASAKARAEELHKLKPHVSVDAALKAVRRVDSLMRAWQKAA